MRLVLLSPQSSTVRLDDRTADRQAHAHAFGLGGVERGAQRLDAPALQAGRGSLISSLKERAGTDFGGLRLRRTIVTAQIAFTLILVIGAALFVRTLTALIAKGPGFDISSLVSFGIDPVRNGYSPAEAARLIRVFTTKSELRGALSRRPLQASSY